MLALLNKFSKWFLIQKETEFLPEFGFFKMCCYYLSTKSRVLYTRKILEVLSNITFKVKKTYALVCQFFMTLYNIFLATACVVIALIKTSSFWKRRTG